MATIRAYTTIEQSRKLAEILPLESADIIIVSIGDREGVKTITMPKETLNILRTPFTDIRDTIPCWSLAALLGVLPNDTSLLYFDDTYQMVYDKKPYVISNKFDNPVDACYEMILKLHELNLL